MSDVILREICATNGLNADTLSEDGLAVEKLEMFFNGLPVMVYLNYFPHLQELKIMSQTITKIENLHFCPQLKKLWICECHLRVLEGLDQCPEIRYLYLYDNEIDKIQNLHCLPSLEVLWLNNNAIAQVEGLKHCFNLTELNLNGNALTEIGDGLSYCGALERLYLSGNSITNLMEICQLMTLSKLKQLSLGDPAYRSNPICQLYNYSTFLLHTLPNLHVLDGFNVSNRMVKEAADSVLVKKRMYYFMRSRILCRNFDQRRTFITAQRDHYLSNFRSKLNFCGRCLHELTRLDSTSTSAAAINTTPRILMASNYLRDKIKSLNNMVHHLWMEFGREMNHLQQDEEWCRDLLMMELTSCGNVRFQESQTGAGTNWLKLCNDLIMSRFCLKPFFSSGLSEVRTLKVVRVFNTLAHRRFESQVDKIVDQLLFPEKSTSVNASVIAAAAGGGSVLINQQDLTNFSRRVRKGQDLVFWCQQAKQSTDHLLHILENGFTQDLFDLGDREEVLFTNSVNVALQHCFGSSDEQLCQNFNFLHRPHRLLICRLVTSFKPVEESAGDKPPPAVSFQRISSTRSAAEADSDNLSLLEETPPHKQCDCAKRQRLWIVRDLNMVVPEFIIDFDFLHPTRMNLSFFSTMQEDDSLPTEESVLSRKSSQLPTMGSLEDFVAESIREFPILLDAKKGIELNDPPNGKSATTLDDLSQWILPFHKTPDPLVVTNLVDLNLTNCGLTALCSLQVISPLKHLQLAHNQLSTLECISGCSHLESLQVSFNCISTLRNVRDVSALVWMDIRWNELQNTREEISLLHNFVPFLTHIFMDNNPWCKPKDIRCRTIGRLRHLKEVNGQPVTDDERREALQIAATSRILPLFLTEYGRCDTSRPRRIYIVPVAEVLDTFSRHYVDKSLPEPVWSMRITSLCLKRQCLSKLSGLDNLVNLKFACFDGNYLTKIDGLTGCGQLEELSLEDNCISALANVSHLIHLKRLLLGRNFIQQFDASELGGLCGLHTFAVDHNYLESLSGIEVCTNLVELYVANNQLTDVRDIRRLKSLQHLLVLDLYGNEFVSRVDNYRHQVLFLLNYLKVLDGEAITVQQVTQAKELLGGKLNIDFLLEKLNTDRLFELRELELPNQSIRSVELIPAERFINLRSVNLESNNLISFSGLLNLTNLRVLCLNHNRIDSLFPKAIGGGGSKAKALSGDAAAASSTGYNSLTPAGKPMLENLEVLHLAYNGIKDLKTLQLHLLPSLKALFLQGNELSAVEGLEGLYDLRELVLDRNKIKSLSDMSFVHNGNLRELHLEENRLRELDQLGRLSRLSRLYLGGNRIQDLQELVKLDSLVSLVEISLINNGLARKMQHRLILVYRLPRLQIIDNVEVTVEERERAEFFFSAESLQSQQQQSYQQQQQQQYSTSIPSNNTIDFSLPGIVTNGALCKTSVPIRVMNVNLGSVLASSLPTANLGGAGDYSSANAGQNNGGVNMRSRGIRPNQNVGLEAGGKPVFFYGPSGHVEQASRLMMSKKK